MRLHRYGIVAISVALLIAPAFSAVKIGDPAPPIGLDALIPVQPVENASLGALAGKAVVLEFWATWCGSCVGAIPHLNELVDRFANRPIQFISVTDEETAIVEEFLKTRPIHGWVGFDRAQRMAKAYGREGIPFTVLIDAKGKVAGLTLPESVKAGDLEDLLAGRPLTLSVWVQVDMSIPRVSLEDGPAPLLDIIVRPSSTGNSGMRSGPSLFQWKASTIRDILSNVYEVDFAFVRGDAAEDPTRYDVSVTGPKNQNEALRKLLPDLLAVAFQVDVRREKRESEGWILKAPHGKPDGLKDAAGYGGSANWGGGKVHVIGGDLAQLARITQSLLGKPVTDQTGISGRFDFDFQYDQKRPESLLDVLREHGFAFEPATLPLEFLIVTKAAR